MNLRDAMTALKAAGTAQNRKVYARHGVSSAMFGVSFANLGKLQKRIGTDQALAERLWATGNHDARILATMVADPAAMKSATLDAWAKDLDSYVVTDAFSMFVARTPHAPAKMRKWTKSSGEWTGQAGWSLVSHLTRTGGLPDAECERLLETIEKGIHRAKNRPRYSMNGALISIGLRGGALWEKATAAAKRIGPVRVDHGETGCKTPGAVAYLAKGKARAKAGKVKAGKAKTTRKAAQRSR